MSNNRSGVSLNLAIANIVLFYLKNYALQYRLLFQTRQRYHPLSFVFWTSYCGCDFKKGYFTRLDAVLKTQPLSKRFHSACLNESLKSLNF
jgi:hypothetical protein